MPMSPKLLRPRASGTALHPEVQDWITRVTANGGTASTNTLAAASAFCAAIDAAGIRNRFYRLNLVCGGQLAAALVPLYRATSATGSALGNSTDTNNGPFVSTDYAATGQATGGLKGNGSSKYLSTGLNPVTISASANDFHMAIYAKGVSATGTSRAYIGNALGTADSTYIGITGSGQTETASIAGALGDRLAAPSGTKEGMMLVATNGSATQTYYLNGATVSNTRSSGFANAAFDVFRVDSFYALDQYIRTYSIGLGISASQESAYRNAVVAFNTALGRNV